MVLSSTVSEIRRFIGRKLRIFGIFFLPLSFSFGAPPLFSTRNFAVKLTMRKLESWGYPPMKTTWSEARSLSHSFWQNISVWRTDRRTDGFIIASTYSALTRCKMYSYTRPFCSIFISLDVKKRSEHSNWHGRRSDTQLVEFLTWWIFCKSVFLMVIMLSEICSCSLLENCNILPQLFSNPQRRWTEPTQRHQNHNWWPIWHTGAWTRSRRVASHK